MGGEGMNDEIIKNIPLFQGIEASDLKSILKELRNQEVSYEKGAYIFEEEDRPEQLYILIEGKVTVAKDTPSGARMIITQIMEPGDMFGEVYLFMKKETYAMYAQATENTRVLVLSSTIFGEKSNLDTKVILHLQENIMKIFATKAFVMNQKIKILGGNTLREKIVRYLFEYFPSNTSIKLPKREELADYLNVTRPSLSRELGKMQDEGMISIVKGYVTITDQTAFDLYL